MQCYRRWWGMYKLPWWQEEEVINSANIGLESSREVLVKPGVKNEYLLWSVLLIPFFELSPHFICISFMKGTCYFVLHYPFTSQFTLLRQTISYLRRHGKEVQSYFHIRNLLYSYKIVGSFIWDFGVVTPLLLPPSLHFVGVSQGSALDPLSSVLSSLIILSNILKPHTPLSIILTYYFPYSIYYYLKLADLLPCFLIYYKCLAGECKFQEN